MPAEVRNGRRRRDQPAKSPMRCRSLRQVFCSFTTSFPRCSVARFPAATLGSFTAAYLPPLPLPQPPSPDQPTKQTCLYQSFLSHSFIPVQTLHICTLALAIPTLYFLLLFSPSFCLFPGGVYLLCSFLPSFSLLPPHADYVISWFVDIPDDSKNMLRLYLIRSISVSHVTLRLTLPSASFSSCPRRLFSPVTVYAS